MLALGFVALTVAGNVVRPYVIGNAMRLRFLFVLVGILARIMHFGLAGVA